MFERYDEKARRVIFYARYEASQFGSPSIEPEHILLAVSREDTDLLTRLLHIPDPEAVLRERIEQRAAPGERISTSVEMSLSASAKSVLKRTHEEMLALGHQHIRPRHLLLGVVGERGCLAADVMSEAGVEYDALRDLIVSDGANG